MVSNKKRMSSINRLTKLPKQQILLQKIINKIHISKTLLLRKYWYLNSRVKYGTNAPVHRENIWINPGDCNLYIQPSIINKMFKCTSIRDASGRVISSEWPEEFVSPVEDFIKIKYCIKHWVEGQSWEQAGAYEHMRLLLEKKDEVDGCKNLADVVRR